MSNDKFSDNERLKQQSQLLRGTIKEDLHNELTGGFLGDNFQLIRFHGMYRTIAIFVSKEQRKCWNRCIR